MKPETVGVIISAMCLIMVVVVGTILMTNTAPATPPTVFQVASIDSPTGNVAVYRIRVNQTTPAEYIYLAVGGASTTVALTNRASSEVK